MLFGVADNNGCGLKVFAFDGLRALAIIAIVGYHAYPALVPGGFVGVDVFFVISGFLIGTIIDKGT
jgi:peptidoglycan/LPS O-acetylase OafA/YrhL